MKRDWEKYRLELIKSMAVAAITQYPDVKCETAAKAVIDQADAFIELLKKQDL